MHRLSVLLLPASITGMATAKHCPGGHDKYPFHPPTPHDSRSPCPLLNALANHGWLPRDGRNISIDEMAQAVEDSTAVAAAAVLPVIKIAMTTSTTGRNDTMNLEDMRKHGVLEHDASLSRQDEALGDNNGYDSCIYESVARHFTEKTISLDTGVKARDDRVKAAIAANPKIHFDARENDKSILETALYQATFGTADKGDARTDWVNVMFREERMPYKEGYRRPKDIIPGDIIGSLIAQIKAKSKTVPMSS